MAKAKFRNPQGIKDAICSSCKVTPMRIDEEAVSGICYKCVCKAVNPTSVIISDLSPKEYKEFITKQNGRSKNNPA
jgi:hypothetical protein